MVVVMNFYRISPDREKGLGGNKQRVPQIGLEISIISVYWYTKIIPLKIFSFFLNRLNFFLLKLCKI